MRSRGAARRTRGRWLACALLALTAGLWGPRASAAGHGEPGPVHPVEIRLPDRRADLKTLADLGIDVDGVFLDRARAYVLEDEEEKLRLLGFDLESIPDEGALAAEREALRPDDVPAYHTYDTLTAELQQIAATHPSIARLESAGSSYRGRALWIMKVTRNPDVEEDEPEFRYVAALHGDEVVGMENCVAFLNLLADGYGSDPRITGLVDSTEIWVMPMANPDGTELHQRYNAKHVDLGRDFPDQFLDPDNTIAHRAPETAAIMTWGFAHSPVLSANFHGGTRVASYPFDGTESRLWEYNGSPDDALFVSLARTYADRNPDMAINNGDSSFDDGICNGADWYVLYGGFQDWNYVWQGDDDVTIEVSDAKWPDASSLPWYWDLNRESMLAYLERAHEGVRGAVTDATTGAPLAATVRVAGIDHSAFTDPDVGDYHHPLLPGHYALEVSAPGYNAAVVDDVEVLPGAPATRADVALRPLRPELRHSANRVLDGSGGNGCLDAGEAADLAITLRDLGAAVTSVTGTIVPTGWHGQVTRAGVSWPDIPTGGSRESNAPHARVSLAPSAPPGARAGFAISWSSSEGSGWTDPFFLETGAPECTAVVSTDVPRPVQDHATASSVLTFAPDREIAEVDVRVDVQHPYVGELRVALVSPSGIPVVLHDRSGGSGDDLVGWYDTDLTPAEPLSRFDGESSTGTWTLAVGDGVNGNAGTVRGWSLRVCGRPFEVATPELRFREIARGVGKSVLDWWPYPGVTAYRVYRSTSPQARASFADVTAEDADATDTRFEDLTGAPATFWLVTGVGPAGEGPR